LFAGVLNLVLGDFSGWCGGYFPKLPLLMIMLEKGAGESVVLLINKEK
jgi:hypothetical protein